MSDSVVSIRELGKMYRLYSKPSDKILDVFGLNKLMFWRQRYFQEFWALRGMNLEIKRGERLGLIGRNGAGKSTLLKIIARTVTATEGDVNVRGKIQALMELGTAFHPEFTGRENIKASLAYQGLSGQQIADKEEEIIDFAELDDFIDQPIKTYSAGMQARLAFSTATAIKPDILIVDEVLGAGDAYFAGKCVERMRKLTDDSETTVLFVSHDLGSVQALCDRAVWIDRGTIVHDGHPLDVIKQYSAKVRQEDEIRLRAKDLKISKKQAATLDAHQDIYQNLLFRLVTQTGAPPTQIHKIRQLSLICGEETLGNIDLGAPMDNAASQHHYILDSPGLMDWGQPTQDSQGYYRPYGNFQGRYGHAPYEFSIPKSYVAAATAMTLKVRADMTPGEAIALELFSPVKQAYARLGNLSDRQVEFVIDPSLVTKTDGDDDALQLREIDTYGSKEAMIENVQLLDDQGAEAKTLYSLEPFEVVMDYRSKVPLSEATFVFCVYLPSGQCASQWIASSSTGTTDQTQPASSQATNQSQLIPPDDYSGRISFKGEQCLLGKGSYVASAAIFKYFNTDGYEPEAYHLLDRCIHFQVCDRNPTDRIDYGICRQPVEVKFSQVSAVAGGKS